LPLYLTSHRPTSSPSSSLSIASSHFGIGFFNFQFYHCPGYTCESRCHQDRKGSEIWGFGLGPTSPSYFFLGRQREREEREKREITWEYFFFFAWGWRKKVKKRKPPQVGWLLACCYYSLLATYITACCCSCCVVLLFLGSSRIRISGYASGATESAVVFSEPPFVVELPRLGNFLGTRAVTVLFSFLDLAVLLFTTETATSTTPYLPSSSSSASSSSSSSYLPHTHASQLQYSTNIAPPAAATHNDVHRVAAGISVNNREVWVETRSFRIVYISNMTTFFFLGAHKLIVCAGALGSPPCYLSSEPRTSSLRS
jgi:hypothetical protein